ncbi:MAG TPA: efflux RND transporter periplasmic adaptor subunit [Bacteroidales bacterium]|nr:efflux RND transporter periplasmic adaptor subunit [Bacteroidales bacterium]
MKRIIIITIAVVVISLISLMLLLRLTNNNQEEDFTEVRRGSFEITVESMGELLAENSMDITGPDIVSNRRFRASPIKVVEIVPEGTIVKKGDFVAELDRSSFVNTLRDEQEKLKTATTEYENKVLDSAIVLSSLRDEIWNQRFVVEESQTALGQTLYESPAVQRQSEIDLDKADRTLEQKKNQYKLKKAQVRTELNSLENKLNAQQRVVDDLTAVLEAFTVKAPADGMVIYKKDRMGQKIKAGTNLNPWDLVVATLPDLSSMLSKIYVSEIDINKISLGLPVQMTVDAFPDKYFRGNITSIANIGEQLPNSDTKVFEVLARVQEYEPDLRPSMTTTNRIIVDTYNDVLYVSNESIHAGEDMIPYVYTKDGRKQIIVPGKSNGRFTIVEKGLEPGVDVWQRVPDKPEKFILAGSELIELIRQKENELARLDKLGNN